MKSFILTTILLFTSCNQFNSPPVSKEEEQQPISQSQTENAISAIKQKPDWLFENIDVCPADAIPETEAEVKYLSVGCADNPDKCLESCRKDDGNACYALALLVQDKYGLEQTDSEALFLRSCKLGIMSGCTNKAAGMINLEEMDESKAICAANTFEKTCLKNDAWGCTMYGFMLSEGNGREQNKKEAIKVLGRVCDGSNDDDPACQRAKELAKTLKNNQKNISVNTSKK